MEALKQMVKEINKDEMEKTMVWLCENTPYRLAGSDDEKRASEYVTAKMKEFGLEAVNHEFYTYNSDPQFSKVEVLEPEHFVVDSLPCAHIKSTAQEGEEFDLVYIGNGSVEEYEGRDVKGKFVLVEVSYAPPVPEKARIACQMGAAGIMCMNWGNDEEVICHRGLKGVWGNPTEETVRNIPEIIGVGVTHTAGLKLKELCQANGSIRVRITAIATREWSYVHEPHGILRGNGKSDQYLLICSHLDAWKPGVTCNATGNATTIELMRVLSQHREELDRDIHFVFWNGHEVAEAAGSTWFVDQYWDELAKKCVLYMHIDSTGVGETEIFEIKASRELLSFAKDNYHQVEGEKDIRSMPLKKIGDQSFMGIGVPSVTMRTSFTQEALEKSHGATLGWWNHTKEDGLDKCDRNILYVDTVIHLALIYKMANVKVLPYEFDSWFEELEEKLRNAAESFGDRLDISMLQDNLASVREKIRTIQDKKNVLSDVQAEVYNRFVKNAAHLLSDVFLTYADKYQQDSYGHSRLSTPIPLFAETGRLDDYPEDSFEYGMILTQLTKNRNRIDEALYLIGELADLTIKVL